MFSALKKLTRPSIDWLLAFVPATLAAEYYFHSSQALIFVFACLAVIPLAGWMGRATEILAEKAGEGVGGLLNATFGNAAELIIALIALSKGMTEVVKASLTGSIMGNILLVMGAACFAGGMRYSEQNFNTTSARVQSSMLTLAVIAMIVPGVHFYLLAGSTAPVVIDLSFDISLVLIATYALSLVFSLHTHAAIFAGEAAQHGAAKEGEGHGSTTQALLLLLFSTALIAWMAEILVGAVEHAAHQFGMNRVFVGVIVVAVIGNAAEHSTAVFAAMKNRMDLSLGIAIGSSVQIALFVAPLLVLLSYFIGPAPMDLVFSPLELCSVGLAVYIAGQIAGDGKSNWLEGAQLLSVYIILGMAFYFVPGH